MKTRRNVSDSQISDAAVQRCEEILQAFARVTGDETNRREARGPCQLPRQVLPLRVRQQVGFIQHQQNSACRNDYGKMSGTVGGNESVWDKEFGFAVTAKRHRLNHS